MDNNIDPEIEKLAEDNTLSEQRLKICRNCENITKRPFNIERCKICHCVLSVKTIFISQKCPINKW